MSNIILAALALLSLALLLWQWLAACRFPLHIRDGHGPSPPRTPAPGVTLLKPLKGSDHATEECLRSWFTQNYAGPIQLLFAVASPDDPAAAVVRNLKAEFPAADAQLVVCGPLTGTNLKVSKLVQLEPLARHEILIVSDADVWAPSDLVSDMTARLADPAVALVNSFYILANASTFAMRWEAVCVNADFWSQVLQSRSLKPLDFALGAVMAARRLRVRDIGGFAALQDCLADDYQLGHRIARQGGRIELSPVVVECRSEPMGWAGVWKHQLRWARTIRVCQPAPYFFSILSNPTLWPLLWLVVCPSAISALFALACWFLRGLAAADLERRLTRERARLATVWLAPVKDLLQTGLWLLAFAGNRIEWRGERMRLRRDGTLVRG